MYALNLTHSPEKAEFWDSADPLIIGAGNTGGALLTSADRHPGVADSIELDDDSGVTRRASENLPKGSWRNIPVHGNSRRVWSTDVEGGGQKTPMRGMETGRTAKV